MIQIESGLFNEMRNAIIAAEPKAFVSAEYIESPAKFPAVTIEEKDNATYERTLDSSGREKHALLMYEINVYSNLSGGKKAQCKKIIEVVDEYMILAGFMRLTCNPIPNIANNSVYRILARYQGIVSDKNVVYKR